MTQKNKTNDKCLEKNHNKITASPDESHDKIYNNITKKQDKTNGSDSMTTNNTSDKMTTETEKFQNGCDERVRHTAEWLEDLYDRHLSEDGDNEDQENFEGVIYEGAHKCDCEVHVGLDGTYRSCEIMVAGGGPTIIVDTAQHGLVLTWGGYRSYYGLRCDVIDYIDKMMEDEWNVMKRL